MDASLCRQQIEALLREESRLLTRLGEELELEFDAIRTNNLDELDQRGTARTHTMSALAKLADERRDMQRLLNYAPGNEGLEKLLRWCDPQRTLSSLWQRRGELATQCRELNERNSVAVHTRLRRIEGMLDVITAQPRDGIYGRDAAPAGRAAGRLLSTEA